MHCIDNILNASNFEQWQRGHFSEENLNLSSPFYTKPKISGLIKLDRILVDNLR